MYIFFSTKLTLYDKDLPWREIILKFGYDGSDLNVVHYTTTWVFTFLYYTRYYHSGTKYNKFFILIIHSAIQVPTWMDSKFFLIQFKKKSV